MLELVYMVSLFFLIIIFNCVFRLVVHACYEMKNYAGRVLLWKIVID